MEILGIDIGGSGIKGAIVHTQNGQLISKRYRIETPSTLMPEDVLPAVASVAQHFHYHGPIGVGFPAVVVDGRPRTPFTAHEVTEWLNYPVADRIAQLTGCPTSVVNDADAAGIAEISFGAGRGLKGSLILLTLGTGIGSALFSEGKLVPNTEFGKIYLQNRADVIEQYLSAAARERRELGWKAWGTEFNDYLRYLEWLFTPNCFIIGGGASKKFARFAGQLDLQANVVPAQMRNQAGIVGAAMAAAAVV